MNPSNADKSFSDVSIEPSLAVDFSNLLPRAVLRPNSFVLLDGEWRFSIDPQDSGLHEGWHLGHEYT
ncbi:MAG: hypothetical protein WKF70_10815, partial [Chitinophagaceae bacterium]